MSARRTIRAVLALEARGERCPARDPVRFARCEKAEGHEGEHVNSYASINTFRWPARGPVAPDSPGQADSGPARGDSEPAEPRGGVSS